MEISKEGASLRHELWEACREDILFYINTFVWLNEPRPRKKTRVIPFVTYPYQDEAIAEFMYSLGVEDILEEKSRDVGFSWKTLSALDWCWKFHDHSSFLMVSRNEKLVDDSTNPKSLFWKLDFIDKHMPSWMMPAGYNRREHRQKLKKLNPENGSVIDGESTTGDVGRGDRRLAILLDEYPAFDLSDGFRALDSTAHATDCRIFGGTPQGAFGAFYKRRQAIATLGGGKLITVHWSAHPEYRIGMYACQAGKLIIIDRKYWEPKFGAAFAFGKEVQYEHKFGKWKGWEFRLEHVPRDIYKFDMFEDGLRSLYWDKELIRANGNRQKLKQEVDIDWQGAGGPFFDEEIITEHIRAFVRSPLPDHVGDLEVRDADAVDFEFMPGALPSRLTLWCQLDPTTKKPPPGKYAVGCDISTGSGASNTCFTVADKKTGAKVAAWVDSHTGSYEAAIIAVALCRFFHGAILNWERNGPGDEFGNKVIDLGYRNLYFTKEDKTVQRKPTKVPGWSPSKNGKRVLLRDYQAALEAGKFTNPCAVSLNECMSFVFDGDKVVHINEADDEDPSGAKAGHGDRVIGDALCWLALGDIPAAKKNAPPENQPLVSSFGGRRELERQEKRLAELKSRY